MKKFFVLIMMGLVAVFIFSGCGDDDPDEVIGTIDPEAISIEFSIVKTTDFTGTATITGTVTNTGDTRFTSDAGKQQLQLFEQNLGGAMPGTLVTTLDFTELNPGESLTIQYSRAWDRASPAEGEFPPNYHLFIVYDPDITLDDNAFNDDSDLTNNEVTESGQGISDLF